MNCRLRADVDADGWSVENKNARLREQPTSEDNALLIAPRERLDRTFTCASNLHFRLHRRCIVAKLLLIKGKLRRRPNLGRQNVLGNAEAEEQPLGEPILRDISDAVSHCRLN